MYRLLAKSGCTVLVFVTMLASCTSTKEYARLYGNPVSPVAAERTIAITPATRHVNVEGGEIIRFDVNGKSFGWQFNVASTVNAFDLNEVAPPGMLNQQVRAYVEPDPKYISIP